MGQDICRNAEISCYLDDLFLRVNRLFGFGKENQWEEGDKGYFQQSPLPCPVSMRLCQGCDLKTPKDIGVV